MNKYFEFAKIEFYQSIHNRAATVGRFGFYGVILFIFSRLWQVVSARTELSLSPADMLWYLAMTELIVISYPLTHLEIEDDVRSGNLAYALTRPASYLWSQLARALGATFFRVISLALAGFCFATLFSGRLPQNLWGLLAFLPLALGALVVSITFNLIIGISAFWIQDSSPVYWVWQKSSFILGGMILPLDIYPQWLRSIAEWTPFVSLIYEPAMAAITMNTFLMLKCLIKLFLWGTVAVLVAQWMFFKASRELSLNGG